MKLRSRWVAGHLLALALGMAGAALMNRGKHRDGGTIDDAGQKDRQSSSSRATESMRHPVPKGSSTVVSVSSTETYRKAWELLQHEPREERLRLREKLLQEWAKVDLAGAVEAALMEPDSAQLLNVFRSILEENPETIRELFAQNPERFGLKSSDLRRWWIDYMAANHPEDLVSKLVQFGSLDQLRALEMCTKRAGGTDQVWALLSPLIRLPDSVENRRLWASVAEAVASKMNAAAVVDWCSGIEGTAGQVILTHAMATLLGRSDYAGAKATYQALEPGLRKQIAQASVLKPGVNADAYQAAIDEVIATDQWGKISKQVGFNLHNMTMTQPFRQSSLDWALQLPEREDTMDLYRVAIRNYLTYQPDKARAWIDTLPQGWKRQNSLAAYVQTTMNVRKDPDDALWALRQITDPTFKQEAEGYFTKYEKATGKTVPR